MATTRKEERKNDLNDFRHFVRAARARSYKLRITHDQILQDLNLNLLAMLR